MLTVGFSGLQNDHKALMKRIEVGLANYYDSHDSIPAEEAVQSNPSSAAPKVTYTTPIAFIKDVINGSPADDAVCIGKCSIIENVIIIIALFFCMNCLSTDISIITKFPFSYLNFYFSAGSATWR